MLSMERLRRFFFFCFEAFVIQVGQGEFELGRVPI